MLLMFIFGNITVAVRLTHVINIYFLAFPDMPDIQVFTVGVLKLLQTMDVSKAMGPDQLPNRALKLAAEEIAPVYLH